MKRTILIVIAVVLASCCLSGCKEKLQQGAPSPLDGDELAMASSLRRHMKLHHDRVGYDYRYIYITVLDSDPTTEFLDYFDDLFQQVRPGSELVEGRYGFEGQPPTKGVFVRFAVVDFERISDEEAWVTCKTFEFEKENPGVRYRMVLTGARWEASDIIQIEDKQLF